MLLLGRFGGVISTLPSLLATTLGAVGVTARTTWRLISAGANVVLVVLFVSVIEFVPVGNFATAFLVYLPELSNVVPSSNLSPDFHVHTIPWGK